MDESLGKVVHPSSLLSGYVNQVRFSDHSIFVMNQLIDFDLSEVVSLTKAVVNGHYTTNIGGLRASEIEDVIWEYRRKRNDWFFNGVSLLEELSASILSETSEFDYVIHSHCPVDGASLEDVVMRFDDMIPQLDVLPEAMVAKINAAICTQHQVQGDATKSFVISDNENKGSGVNKLVYRAKTLSSWSNKIANYRYGAGLKKQLEDRAEVLTDDQAFSVVTHNEYLQNHQNHITDEEISLQVRDGVKAMIDDKFPARTVTVDGKLWIPGTNAQEIDGNPHLIIQRLKDEDKVWEFKEIADDCNWEGYQGVISSDGALYEIHVQTKDHFDLAQEDHSDYKQRQLSKLPPEVLVERNNYQKALHDLFMYVALSRNVSAQLLQNHPILATQFRNIRDFYS